MRQTVEEAALQELMLSYAIVVEGELVYQRQAMLNMFKKGADWQSKKSPWISVEERLPKDFKPILILLKDGKVRTALLDSNYYPHNNEFEIIYFWHDREANESFDLEDVVAWMPIPSFDEILEANKDVLERIKEKAAWLKQIYEAPNPEVDKIIAELREDVKNNPMPKNMTKDEEIAWILKEANGEDDFEKLQAIISEDVTVQTEKLKESIVAHFQEACGASYSFRDILDNLDDDAIQEEIIKWARCNFLRLQIIGEKGEMQ
jgi:hypothetical protein